MIKILKHVMKNLLCDYLKKTPIKTRKIGEMTSWLHISRQAATMVSPQALPTAVSPDSGGGGACLLSLPCRWPGQIQAYRGQGGRGGGLVQISTSPPPYCRWPLPGLDQVSWGRLHRVAGKSGQTTWGRRPRMCFPVFP